MRLPAAILIALCIFAREGFGANISLCFSEALAALLDTTEKSAKFWDEIDTDSEPNRDAFSVRAGKKYYYEQCLSDHDQHYLSKPPDTVRLEDGNGNIGTTRKYPEIIRRLGLTDHQVRAASGQKWLSVGEGQSNFIAEAASRGINGVGVDAAVINVHAPNRSVIAYAQTLPFSDGHFDKTVSVWLIPHFFKGTAGSSMFNPAAGRRAIAEMIRVTQLGGEVIINPMTADARQPILDFLEFLKERALIRYEVVNNGDSNTAQYTSVHVVRLK